MRLVALLLGVLLAGSAQAQTASEFGAPYAIRLLPGGGMVELSGSFSWAVPQSLSVLLLRTPNVRTVRLFSPGGNVRAAVEVAKIVRAHGLDTYVERSCASACTIAFLGGKNRFLAPGAWLGFHQASSKGVDPDRFNPFMRAAYAGEGVPQAFIDHVLRTPPQSIWFPVREELLAAGLVTGLPPANLYLPEAPVTEGH